MVSLTPKKSLFFFFCLALKEKESSNVFKWESALGGRAKSASSKFSSFHSHKDFPRPFFLRKKNGANFYYFFSYHKGPARLFSAGNSILGQAGTCWGRTKQWWCHHNLSLPLFVYFHRPEAVKSFSWQTNPKLCHKRHKRNAGWVFNETAGLSCWWSKLW